MRIVTLLFLLATVSSTAQTLLPYNCKQCIGDGSQVVIFPTGAYVPDAWIDQAVDSTGVRNEGRSKHNAAVGVIATQARVIHTLDQLNDSLRSIQQRERVSFDLGQAELRQQLANRDRKIGKLKGWAGIGKFTVGVGILGAVVWGVNEIRR